MLIHSTNLGVEKAHKGAKVRNLNLSTLPYTDSVTILSKNKKLIFIESGVLGLVSFSFQSTEIMH